jgi:hypothetical protein
MAVMVERAAVVALEF